MTSREMNESVSPQFETLLRLGAGGGLQLLQSHIRQDRKKTNQKKTQPAGVSDSRGKEEAHNREGGGGCTTCKVC